MQIVKDVWIGHILPLLSPIDLSHIQLSCRFFREIVTFQCFKISSVTVHPKVKRNFAPDIDKWKHLVKKSPNHWMPKLDI